MDHTHSEHIARALALLSEAIDLLEGVRVEEEKALESIPESPDVSDRIFRKNSLASIENAIADMLNVEDWLESAKA